MLVIPFNCKSSIWDAFEHISIRQKAQDLPFLDFDKPPRNLEKRSAML